MNIGTHAPHIKRINFQSAKARQPEIIRTVQKDLFYTNGLTQDLFDVLKNFDARTWIRYNDLYKVIVEIIYHGFATVNGLQTLGEEYTGIMQIDSEYVALPSKVVQFISIILEYGGEILFIKVMGKFEKDIANNEEIDDYAKEKLINLIKFIRAVSPFIKSLNKIIFYFNSNKYQLSKRFTGINYIVLRRWLRQDHELYGYKWLGTISLLQFLISALCTVINEYKNKNKIQKIQTKESKGCNLRNSIKLNRGKDVPNCPLCLEPRSNTSLTTCGHLFCWDCILGWLDQQDGCPICREIIKKSNIVPLQNYL